MLLKRPDQIEAIPARVLYLAAYPLAFAGTGPPHTSNKTS